MLYPRIILALITIILAATPSDGYFKKSDDSEFNGRKLCETIALSRQRDLFIPVVYKNTLESKTNIQNNTILGYQSNLLTELMELDIRNVQQRFQPNILESGRLIENLIYANLRIQSLIDQYNKLHEDAEYFQKTYLSPMAGDAAPDGDGKKQVDASLTAGDYSRITSEYELLKHQFASTSKISDIKVPTKPDSLDSGGNLPIAVGEYQSTFQTFTPKRFNGVYKPRIAQKSELPSTQDNTDAEKTADERQRHPPVRTSDMPWMIRFVVSTVDYFIQNKIESFIYLGMIVFIVSILAGGRR